MPDAGNGSVQLLEADPELARGLDPRRVREVSQRLFARAIDVPRGPWSPARALAGGTNPIGLLVLDGLLVREAIVGDHPCAELLGPGDLLRAWEDRDAEVLLPRTVEWSALSTVRAGGDRSGARRPRRAVAGDLRLARRARRPPGGAARRDAGDRPPHPRGRPPARAAVVPGRALGPRRARRRRRLAAPPAPHARRHGRRAPPVRHHRARSVDRRGEVERRPDGGWLLLGDPPEARQRPVVDHSSVAFERHTAKNATSPPARPGRRPALAAGSAVAARPGEGAGRLPLAPPMPTGPRAEGCPCSQAERGVGAPATARSSLGANGTGMRP